MDKDEALKMAINKWQNNFADERHNNQAEIMYWFNQYKMAFNELLNACKEALEQPAQEPVAWMYYEKVTTSKEKAEIYVKNPIPLYTHPHQDKTSPSKWTALTDDEIQELTHDGVADEYDIKFARAVLAKAKEKNYYGPT